MSYSRLSAIKKQNLHSYNCRPQNPLSVGLGSRLGTHSRSDLTNGR